MDINIIKASEKDLEEFITLYAKYFNDENDDFPLENVRKRLNQIYTMNDSIFLLAKHNDNILGGITGYLDWFETPVLHIVEILVLKEYQNNNIGTLLIQEIEKRAKTLGATSIYLETLNDEKHENFYIRNGFITNTNLIYKYKKI